MFLKQFDPILITSSQSSQFGVGLLAGLIYAAYPVLGSLRHQAPGTLVTQPDKPESVALRLSRPSANHVRAMPSVASSTPTSLPIQACTSWSKYAGWCSTIFKAYLAFFHKNKVGDLMSQYWETPQCCKRQW